MNNNLYRGVQVRYWSGPTSIALFLPDLELGLGLQFIQYLRSCYPAVERQVLRCTMHQEVK